MMHGCTEPSSTLHPYAFAMPAHSITDPIGAKANATISTSASTYQNHGNFLCGVAFIIGIVNQESEITSLTCSLVRQRACWSTPCCSAQSQRAADSVGSGLCVCSNFNR